MADETSDPIANTAQFRAFSADDQESTSRRPSLLVWLTAVVLLVALVGGALAFAL